MTRTLVLVNLALIAFAQAPAEPEIRGTITEFGVATPVAGAAVTISEFVVIDSVLTRKPITTVYADSRGSFAYKPGHIGRFWVEAHRDGYTNPQAGSTFVNGMGVSETSADLTKERTTSNTTLMLFRPGTLTGRVVDDDGNPATNMTVHLIQPGITTPAITAKTDNDGNFTFAGLPFSSRVIQIGPAAVDVMDTFTETDLKAVDWDFEVSYWPGGAKEPDQALPIQVTPGATVNIGTLRGHKIEYYRAHLKFDGECGANENWVVMFTDSLASPGSPPDLRSAKCRKELLIRMLRPGSRTLAIMTGIGGTPRRWALVDLNIRDENVTAQFSFSPSEDIPVRLVDRDGGTVPAIKDARLMLRSAVGFAQSADLDEKNPTVRNAILSRQQIVFSPAPTNVAIQEIRYDRLPVLNGAFEIVRGATLEIVVDQRPASLSFTGAAPGSMVLLAKWPLPTSLATSQIQPPYITYGPANNSGIGQIPAIAAGEYRMIAMPPGEIASQALLELFSKGEKITLERGEQKSIEVKMPGTAR